MSEPTRENIIQAIESAIRHDNYNETFKIIRGRYLIALSTEDIMKHAADLLSSDSTRIAELEAENARLKVVLTDKLSAWRAEGDSDEHETYETGYKNGYKYGQINLIQEVLGVAEPPETESEGSK